MALSQVYTAVPNDVITAARWNNEFGNIYNNSLSLVFPVTAAVSFAGYTITLDDAGVTTLSTSGSQGFSLTPGAKTGTPNTTGKAVNVVASTFTDSNTAIAGTAASFASVAIQRPTLAATNTTVVTTDAATLYVANAPAAGTNETLTNAYAAWFDDGDVRIDGQLVGLGGPIMNELRLTLTTGLPVTIADVTGAGTLYLTPYTGKHISLYDGTIWKTFSTAEISLALTLTSGKPYDIFGIISAGAPALEVLVWTNDTTRATALAYQDGVLVKSGATTRRYLGTLYSSGANTTEDSAAKRYLWNYYNRKRRYMRVVEGADTWQYTLVALQQARASTANQLDFVTGVEEEPIEATVNGLASNNGAGGVAVRVGIGLGNTTNIATINIATSTAVANLNVWLMSQYTGFPGVGRRTLWWLEASAATGITTWVGDGGAATTFQTGIHGIVVG